VAAGDAEPPLLFDLDGTLVHSLPDIACSVNHVRSSFKLPDLSAAEVRSLVGDGLTRLLERALPDVPAADLRRAEEIYRAHHLRQCVRLVQPYPGVLHHLRAWHSLGWPMAVVTNKSAVFAERILDALDMRRFLPIVIDGESGPDKKPSPQPCRRALAALGVRSDRGTMIGDGVQDLRAGKAAGLRTIAVLYGYRDAGVLTAEGADAYWTAFGVAAS
jgi:phosphoglycolate phosphatase